MENTTQSIIKELVARLHGDILKPRGFKKSAHTWIRTDGWSKLINLQLSKSNTSAEASFTLNLGVFIRELHDAAGSYSVTGEPKEPDCDIRTRVGMLLPSGTDKWWKVTPASNTGRLFDEVSADLIDAGLPWLESLQDYSTVATELMRQKNHFLAAIAHKLDGRGDAAAESMEMARAKANKLALPKLKMIAEALGIPLKG